MKIFLSWSGAYSQAVAAALKEWLPYIFSDVEPFFSTDSIRKGNRWRTQIAKELSISNFGIICLAPGNLEAPWLLYEAGALSKLKTSQACTLLLGNLRPGDIEGPLSDFQATAFNKLDMLKLVQSINNALGKGKVDESRLKVMFDKWWDDLEKKVNEAAHLGKSSPEKRKSEDVLYEILELSRSTAKQVANLSTDNREIEKLRKLLNMGVVELGTTDMVRALLLRHNIQTIGDLSTYSEDELRKTTGLPRVAINTLKERLAALGLTLSMTYDPSIYERGAGRISGVNLI